MGRICAKCNIKTINNKQKYCKNCAYIVQLERKKKFINDKRKKEKGTFGPNPIKGKNGAINFDAEQKAILKEMRRLGLRKKHD